MPRGAMVFSLDFELAWGTRTSSEAPPPPGLSRVEEVVERLLAIFARHGVSATWATVGHLVLRREELMDGRFNWDLPEPDLPWFQGKWYEGIPAFDSDAGSAYYAPELVRAILDCPVPQELACHTFTHMLLGDGDCTSEVAAAELWKSQQAAGNWGVELSSLVFPRNRVGHLAEVAAAGFRCYRGENSEWYWFGHASGLFERRWLRLPVWCLRYLDERLCLTPPLPPVRHRGGLWEIPHSMFFPGMRGVSKWITPAARVRRAVKGLRRAARQHRVFSIWTHPHNFLPEPEPLLGAVDDICREAARLREAGRLEILSMQQMADRLDAGKGAHWLQT